MLWGLFVTTAEPGGPDGFRWKSLVPAVQRIWGCGGDIKLCPSPFGKYSPLFFFIFQITPGNQCGARGTSPLVQEVLCRVGTDPSFCS